MKQAMAAVAGLALVAVLAFGSMTALRAAAGGSGSGSVKVEVRLAPPAGAGSDLASGKAKGEQRTDRTRFAVEVEDVSTPPGDYPVQVTRGGAPVDGSAGITVTVDTLGFGETELNTQDGAPVVPVVLAGDQVDVIDPASGNVILTGVLAPK